MARTVESRSGRQHGKLAADLQGRIIHKQSIIDSVPDKKERQRRQLLVHQLGVLGPGEEYKEPEVDVAKVQADIQSLVSERRSAEKEDEFQRGELLRMHANLTKFESRIRRLEQELGLEHGKLY